MTSSPDAVSIFLACPKRASLAQTHPFTVAALSNVRVALTSPRYARGGPYLVVSADIPVEDLEAILCYGRQMQAIGREEGISEQIRCARREAGLTVR